MVKKEQVEQEKIIYPKLDIFTELDFASVLFATMRLKGFRRFESCPLSDFIAEQAENSDYQKIYLDVNRHAIVEKGVLLFTSVNAVKIIYNGTKIENWIHFNKEQAAASLKYYDDEAVELIDRIVNDYQQHISNDGPSRTRS